MDEDEEYLEVFVMVALIILNILLSKSLNVRYHWIVKKLLFWSSNEHNAYQMKNT